MRHNHRICEPEHDKGHYWDNRQSISCGLEEGTISRLNLLILVTDYMRMFLFLGNTRSSIYGGRGTMSQT